MRHYEIVFLVHPDQSAQVPAMLERYQDLVTEKGGQIHRSENWGRRQLAYMINDVYKAHYVMFNIECDLDTLREIERNFKFNDSIIRSLVIRRNNPVTEKSQMAKTKDDEDVAEAERKEADNKRAKEKELASRETDEKNIEGGKGDEQNDSDTADPENSQSTTQVKQEEK